MLIQHERRPFGWPPRTQKRRKTALLLCALFFISFSPAASPLQLDGSGTLARASGEVIPVQIAAEPRSRAKGLSGVRENAFGDREGVLFWYESDASRRFWMPDTHFDLTIVFLNADFEVLHIDRRLSAHPGFKEPPAIPLSSEVVCRYVLELKAGTDLSRSIRVGERFLFDGFERALPAQRKSRTN